MLTAALVAASAAAVASAGSRWQLQQQPLKASCTPHCFFITPCAATDAALVGIRRVLPEMQH